MKRQGRVLAVLLFFAASTIPVLAQTSTTFTADFAATGSTSPTGHVAQNLVNGVVTGSAGALGPATLEVHVTGASNSRGDTISAPATIAATLWFNAIDGINISYTLTDLSVFNQATQVYSGGTITGGTGAWTGATGTLSVTIADAQLVRSTISGTGNVTVGGKTTPLTLSNFHTDDSTGEPTPRIFTSIDFAGTATPFGAVTGNLSSYDTPNASGGTFTITVSKTDSIILAFALGSTTPASFSAAIAGGTGAYVGASGTATVTPDLSSNPPKFHMTGTVTTAGPSAPIITGVKTAFGWKEVSFNTWLQINGTNLVPTNTPSAGVDWSNAPDFASGKMPTKLDGISVTINNRPAYIYFFCSAVTDPACKAGGDQINVLAPLLDTVNEIPAQVVVSNNGVTSAAFSVMKGSLSPAFFLFDATGHVVARHLDFSLMGPTSLYPGASTPAKAGETLILVGSGFGPAKTPLTEGSSTQSGTLPASIVCNISGSPANVATALISPGLYQLNVTVPAGTPSGDNPIACMYNGYPTAPGALIAVQ